MKVFIGPESLSVESPKVRYSLRCFLLFTLIIFQQSAQLWEHHVAPLPMTLKFIIYHNLSQFWSEAHPFSFTIKGNPIHVLHEVCDLGFLARKGLRFGQHCERIVVRSTRVMYNLFIALSTKASIFLQAYKTYVRPILEYRTVIFNLYKRVWLL